MNYKSFCFVFLFIDAVDKIFTRLPVAAVAPNINSVDRQNWEDFEHRTRFNLIFRNCDAHTRYERHIEKTILWHKLWTSDLMLGLLYSTAPLRYDNKNCQLCKQLLLFTGLQGLHS